MNIEISRGKHSFDSRFFSIEGKNYELTGVETDRFGNTIDHVKDLQTNKTHYIGRMRLVWAIQKETVKNH